MDTTMESAVAEAQETLDTLTDVDVDILEPTYDPVGEASDDSSGGSTLAGVGIGAGATLLGLFVWKKAIKPGVKKLHGWVGKTFFNEDKKGDKDDKDEKAGDNPDAEEAKEDVEDKKSKK